MLTRFETLASLLAALIAVASTLVVGVWKLKGWVDRLNQTDEYLVSSVQELTAVTKRQHKENVARIRAVERRLGI